ncbi:hypothetical protein ERJ75_001717600 [Trypanosoma vivax]|nr:hypothetical protein ERJ75_001717600 [Trypanosoma vivax]
MAGQTTEPRVERQHTLRWHCGEQLRSKRRGCSSACGCVLLYACSVACGAAAATVRVRLHGTRMRACAECACADNCVVCVVARVRAVSAAELVFTLRGLPPVSRMRRGRSEEEVVRAAFPVLSCCTAMRVCHSEGTTPHEGECHLHKRQANECGCACLRTL